MSTVFTIESRKLGTSLSTLRKNQLVPAVLYGKSLDESVSVQLTLKSLQSILASRTTTTLFQFEFNGENIDCILRDYQTDNLHTKVLHADFQLVKPDETIIINLPIELTGGEHLRGQKMVANKVTPLIPIQCKASELPKSITLDIGTMKKGDKILVSDLTLPDSSEVLVPENTVIVSIS